MVPVFALAAIALLSCMSFVTVPVDAYTDSGTTTVDAGQWLYWDALTFTTQMSLSYTGSVSSYDPNFDAFLVTASEYSNYQSGSTFYYIVACSKLNTRTVTVSCTQSAGSYVLIFDNTDAGDAKPSGYSATFTYSVSATGSSSGSLSVTAYSDKTSGSSPLSVQFYATPSGGTSPYYYSWTFGDSQTSASASPIHTYRGSGTYHATVTVADSAYNTVTSSTITIIVSGSNTPNDELALMGLMICIVPIIIIVVIIIVVIYFVMRGRRQRAAPYAPPPQQQPYMQPGPQPMYQQPPPPPMDPYGGGYNQPPPPPMYGGPQDQYGAPPPPPGGQYPPPPYQ